MLTPCDRCGTLYAQALTPEAPLLWLCAHCPVGTPCAPYQHQWRGSRQGGVWVCHTCGETLASTTISTDVGKAPPSMPADVT